MTITRFAPSPTGRLHLGHAYSALISHDFARVRGGDFLLRIEDIDAGRARPEHVSGIIEDLAWLGLHYDGEPVFQSERLHIYQQALDRLRDAALIYPCFCTRAEIAAEIAASASAPHGPDGPVYPGTCRQLSPSEREGRVKQEAHAWRIDMTEASRRTDALIWTDHGRSIAATPEIFGDVILARKDAPTSYHLAVVIDDDAQGVTDVVRGKDLFDATHIHRLLQALLGLSTPAYHHHALLTDAAGNRLAKRAGSPAIETLRAAGTNPTWLTGNLRQGRLPVGYRSDAA